MKKKKMLGQKATMSLQKPRFSFTKIRSALTRFKRTRFEENEPGTSEIARQEEKTSMTQQAPTADSQDSKVFNSLNSGVSVASKDLSTIDWKQFVNFSVLCSQEEDDDIVMLPRTYRNQQQIEMEIKEAEQRKLEETMREAQRMQQSHHVLRNIPANQPTTSTALYGISNMSSIVKPDTATSSISKELDNEVVFIREIKGEPQPEQLYMAKNNSHWADLQQNQRSRFNGRSGGQSGIQHPCTSSFSNDEPPLPFHSFSNTGQPVPTMMDPFLPICWTDPLPLVNHEIAPPLRTDQPRANITICSYNVLCEGIKQRCMHLYTEQQQQISWEARKQLLLDEITKLNADVFCLQEVQYEHYAELFEPFFTSVGFNICHTRRGGIDNIDGCALAYREERFQKLRFDPIHFNYDVEGFNKNNVGKCFGCLGYLPLLSGQIVMLQEKDTGITFVVANTHILFNMNRGDIKTGQIALLLAAVDKYIDEFPTKNSFAGTFICGDFNMDPFSPLYNFIREGLLLFSKFSRDCLALGDSKGIRGKYACEKFRVNDRVPLDPSTCKMITKNGFNISCGTVEALQHDQRYLSAYRHTKMNGEVEISTRHNEYGCPDFIFYSGIQEDSSSPTKEHRIRIRKILVLPSLSIIDNTCGKMPNSQCGSDHLPLMAEFLLS